MQEARSLQIGELHLRDEVIKHASNAVRDVRRPVELRLAEQHLLFARDNLHLDVLRQVRQRGVDYAG